MSQTLSQKFDGMVDLEGLEKDIHTDVTGNLSPRITLRPYQVAALERFLYYIEDYNNRPSTVHLLFHMATGSGKTVLMAALILYLYRCGFRNFMFFVNSTQIIEKTKDNFLNPASNKYLFGDQIRINDKLVDIREVDTFDATPDDAIKIHFTTIQSLHSRILNPRENTVTIEDFSACKIVLISDEAHHLNAETKLKLTTHEEELKRNWENTVSGILYEHPKNILLEFTATVDLEHEAIQSKYQDKILYDYPLKKFREDCYSKDIELRQADLQPRDRMLQAIVLSQYRRKIAEANKLHCKPVILMKSKTIAESKDSEELFHLLIETVDGDSLTKLRTDSVYDKTLSSAFDFIIEKRGVAPDDLARELRIDFAREKVTNVNRLDDLKNRQIALNTLENYDNELRVIFAVDKLNEGWDVLNLFDIVRLYDTRDGRENKVGNTTMQEAQLIGRGARYFPFTAPDQPDAAYDKRKYDQKVNHPLRILEQLHYHCSHNPRYIQDIRNALRETGMLDETSLTVTLRVKDNFKASEFYLSGQIWVNKQIKNTHDGVEGLDDYLETNVFTFPQLQTGQVIETGAFSESVYTKVKGEQEPVEREFNLSDFEQSILRFALDSNEFFCFQQLRRFFPSLRSIEQFMTYEKFLGKVVVKVSGKREDLQTMSARQKVRIMQFVLREIELSIRHNSYEYLGTKTFEPRDLKTIVVDKMIKVNPNGETGLRWQESNIDGLSLIDLTQKDWHIYDDCYGTDQEKKFIRYLNDNADQLKKIYKDFYLLRNEKLFKIYAFETGQAIEPDYVLFLRPPKSENFSVIQLFIEPKGEHLRLEDKWKEDFLVEIRNKAKLNIIFQSTDYVVYGLPFFNSQGTMNKTFSEAIEPFLAM